MTKITKGLLVKVLKEIGFLSIKFIKSLALFFFRLHTAETKCLATAKLNKIFQNQNYPIKVVECVGSMLIGWMGGSDCQRENMSRIGA